MALVPLVGLLLNYTPWKIRLTPIVISPTILILGLAGVGTQYGISAEVSQSQTMSQPGTSPTPRSAVS